jgi:hypothetical protein
MTSRLITRSSPESALPWDSAQPAVKSVWDRLGGAITRAMSIAARASGFDISMSALGGGDGATRTVGLGVRIDHASGSDALPNSIVAG